MKEGGKYLPPSFFIFPKDISQGRQVLPGLRPCYLS
jgi:hypothetical protein